MEICEHHIQMSEIIGIGPLMVELSKDYAMSSLNERKLWFLVYTKSQSIKIESNLFQLKPDDENIQKKPYDEFEKEYRKARNFIITFLKSIEYFYPS